MKKTEKINAGTRGERWSKHPPKETMIQLLSSMLSSFAEINRNREAVKKFDVAKKMCA